MDNDVQTSPRLSKIRILGIHSRAPFAGTFELTRGRFKNIREIYKFIFRNLNFLSLDWRLSERREDLSDVWSLILIDLVGLKS